eukprot:GHVP01021882.1.p1 GENE.GHVP01021882.1~~GHVP01021882.1.p1  ORF type:complete len:1124 (+),score=223.39 GHVP01021882.1:616-3987(+)
MLEAAGLPPDFYEWPDIQGKPVSDILAETLATMDRRGLDPGDKIPVNAKGGKYKSFVSNYKLFASTIVQRCCSESIEATTKLFDIFDNFYKDATLSKARFLRHSSVLLLYGVCDGICAAIASTKRLQEKFTQQLAAEKKRKENSVTEIKKNIHSAEEMMSILEKQLRKIVASTQRLRHKDVSPEIRLHTCEALVSWARTLPEIFLEDDSHKRYLAWSTTDSYEAVRICSLSFILECLQDLDYKRKFLMNASPCVQIMIERLVFAAKDPNATVRAVSVDCCFEIVQEIEDQYFEELLDCIWRNEDPAVAAKLGLLVDKAVFSNPIARPFPPQNALVQSQEKSNMDVLEPQIIDGQNDSKDMLDINSLLEYVMEFAKEHLKDMEKLVKCFWEIAPALRNVPIMIKALLGENVFLADGVSGPLQEAHRLPLLFILLSVISIISQDLSRLQVDTKKNEGVKEIATLKHIAFTSMNLLFKNLKELLQKTKVREQELQVMCQIIAEAASLSSVGVQLPSSECLHILSNLFKERVDAATLECCAAAIGSLTDVAATDDVKEKFFGLFYSDVSLLNPMLSQIETFSNHNDPVMTEGSQSAGLQSVALSLRRLVLLAKYSSFAIFSDDLEAFVDLLLRSWKTIHKIKRSSETSVVILQIEREIVTLVNLLYSHLWSTICEEIDTTSWDNDRLLGENSESQPGVPVRGARKRIRNSPPSKARKRIRRKDFISDEKKQHDKEDEEYDESQYNISSEDSLENMLRLVCAAERMRDVFVSFLQTVISGYKNQNCWLNLNALEAAFEIVNINKLPLWYSSGGRVEEDELSIAYRLRDKFISLGEFPYSTRHLDILANCVHYMLSDAEVIDTSIVLPQGSLHGVNVDYFRSLAIKDVRLESPFDVIKDLGQNTNLTNDIVLRLSCAKLAADLVIESGDHRIWTSKVGGAVLARLNVSSRPELSPAAKVFLLKIKASTETDQPKVLWNSVIAALRYLNAPADYKLFLAAMWKIVQRNFVRHDIESYVQFVLDLLKLPLKRETSVELVKIFAQSAGRGQGGSVLPVVDQKRICQAIVEDYLSANEKELHQLGRAFANSFLTRMATSYFHELLDSSPAKPGKKANPQTNEESDESSEVISD